MNWQTLIADLIAAGMTQMQISDACGAAQSSVSALARGKSTSPSFDLGMRLVTLHTERAGKPLPQIQPAASEAR